MCIWNQIWGKIKGSLVCFYLHMYVLMKKGMPQTTFWNKYIFIFRPWPLLSAVNEVKLKVHVVTKWQFELNNINWFSRINCICFQNNRNKDQRQKMFLFYVNVVFSICLHSSLTKVKPSTSHLWNTLHYWITHIKHMRPLSYFCGTYVLSMVRMKVISSMWLSYK